MYRTHNCGELRKISTGRRVKLAGWIDVIRDHGGVEFIHLRDMHGVTQVVFDNPEDTAGLGREYVIAVDGIVRERNSETVNEKLPTGEIELCAEKVTVLGKSLPMLPFVIDESIDTREDVRLKYRFLDLRNPTVQKNIIKRAEIIRFMRRQMEDMGFLEIQTPILTSSSPEGARDYLVPSRKHHGMFYALPQAPQIFKQLLMVSGFDKYFQVAPCFRDEDARADRSPGEFYQLDFEMAFATQEDVFAVAEKVLYSTFSEFANGKEVSPAPFVKIPFAECMLKYGTDKPDLRNPLVISDLTDFFADVDFAPFKGKPVRGIVAPNCATGTKSFFENMLKFATEEVGMGGLGYISALENGNLKGPIVKFLSEEKQKNLNLQENDTIFFICDAPQIVDRLAGQIRTKLGEKLNLLTDKFEFCFVTDFPMYEKNPDTGAIEFSHNPFSMPQSDIFAETDPLQIKAYQYDIVCNGVELSSGAVRNHRPDIMIKAFEIAGYTKDDIMEKFPALFGAFHYGAPPHAGMAPGIDRIVMLLTGQENIREVIAFPMNANAQDLLMGAPGAVTEQQLREAHIKIRGVV